MTEQPERQLTLKQEKFVSLYIELGNGAQAAREAGYKVLNAKQQATENLAKPYLKKAIATKRNQLMQDSDTKIALYLSMLEAESTSADQSSSRIRALELLLKANGAFIERSEVVSFDGAFLADLSDIEPDVVVNEEGEPVNPFEIKELH